MPIEQILENFAWNISDKRKALQNICLIVSIEMIYLFVKTDLIGRKALFSNDIKKTRITHSHNKT